ncbi:MAG: autotransporter domain-containing protein [Gammaproteobacteria bacterium]|nr:autotransporter domain-containing protein [Gammaproteobacteria bacterium]
MSITASPVDIYVNEPLTYTVTVFFIRTGITSTDNNDVRLTYGLPPSFALSSVTTTLGSCQSGDVVECNLGSLGNAVATVVITVLPGQEGTINSVINANGTSGDKLIANKTNSIDTVVKPPPEITLKFSEALYTVNESARIATITVTRNDTVKKYARAVSVDFSISDGSASGQQDYTPTSGTLLWSEGDTEPKTFSIFINDDLFTEDDETVNLSLSNPQDASIGGDPNARLIIIDDEAPGKAGFSSDTYRAGEIDGGVTISVLRSEGSDGGLSVDYLTVDGSAIGGEDYTPASGTLTWADGDLSPKTFRVMVLHDDFIEGNETIGLALNNPSNRGALAQASATIILLDNVSASDAVAALTAAASNPAQLAMAQTLGRLCQSGQAGKDLQERCADMVVNAATNPAGVAYALQQAAPEEFASQGRLALETASRQMRNVNTRLMALRSGATGLSLDELKLTIQGKTVPLPSDSGSDPETQLEGKPMPGQKNKKLSSGAAHLFGLYKLGIFVNGNIGIGDKDTSERESGFKFTELGITAGIDYRFADTFILGLALGYSQADADFYESAGNIDLENLSVSVYGTFYRPKKFYLDVLYGHGLAEYGNRRKLKYVLRGTSVNQFANSSTDGKEKTFSLSGGIHFHFDSVTLTPTLRMDSINAGIDAFHENMSAPDTPGSGLAVAIERQDIQSLTLALGLQAAVELKQDSGTTLIPQFTLEWVSESENKQRSITGRFVDDAGRNKFELKTDTPDKNYMNLGLGMAMEFGKGKSAFINYETILDLRGVNNHSFIGGIRLEF